MNKALHAIVYVTFAVACAALYFELQLFDKKELLKDRNRQLEDYLVKISNTIEKSDAPKSANVPEARKDVSPIEAKELDSPEMENLLEDYAANLEEANLDTMKWDDKERIQLRKLYATTGDGEKIDDPANPGDFIKKGPGTAQEILDQLFERAKAQQAKLNSTRAALAEQRTKIENIMPDYNKIKADARKDKVAVEEKKAELEEMEKAKAAVEEQLQKIKGQIDDLNAEVKSLKDEISGKNDEIEAVKEDLAKKEKLADQLMKRIQTMGADRPIAAAASGTVAAAPLTAGNKGKLVEVNSKLMFVIVEFSDEAMQELLGAERQNAMPLLEMGIRRKDFQGPAGEYVGRIRLRQNIAGKNFVVADILGNWQQSELKKGDEVFAE